MEEKKNPSTKRLVAATASRLGVLATDADVPVVTETTMEVDLLHAVERVIEREYCRVMICIMQLS